MLGSSTVEAHICPINLIFRSSLVEHVRLRRCVASSSISRQSHLRPRRPRPHHAQRWPVLLPPSLVPRRSVALWSNRHVGTVRSDEWNEHGAEMTLEQPTECIRLVSHLLASMTGCHVLDGLTNFCRLAACIALGQTRGQQQVETEKPNYHLGDERKVLCTGRRVVLVPLAYHRLSRMPRLLHPCSTFFSLCCSALGGEMECQ